MGGGAAPSAIGVPSGSISTHSFYGWLLFVVAAFSVVGVWHYKKTRDDMREQVRTILADYMPLTDSEQGGAGGMGGGGMQMQQAVQGMMGMGSPPPGAGAPQYSSPMM